MHRRVFDLHLSEGPVGPHGAATMFPGPGANPRPRRVNTADSDSDPDSDDDKGTQLSTFGSPGLRSYGRLLDKKGNSLVKYDSRDKFRRYARTPNDCFITLLHTRWFVTLTVFVSMYLGTWLFFTFVWWAVHHHDPEKCLHGLNGFVTALVSPLNTPFPSHTEPRGWTWRSTTGGGGGGGQGRISVSQVLCEISVSNLFGVFQDLHGETFRLRLCSIVSCQRIWLMIIGFPWKSLKWPHF